MVAGFGAVVEGAGDDEVGITREVAIGQDDVLAGIADVAEEAVAPVVEGVAEACATAFEADVASAGVEGEVVSLDGEWFEVFGKRHDGFAAGGALDFAAVRASGDVDAVVEAPDGVVHDGLDVEFFEAGEDLLPHIGDAVVIRVFEIPDVGSGGDKDAAFPAGGAGGPGEAVGEDGGFVEGAVAIGVGEEAHLAEGQVGGVFLRRLVGGFVGVGVVVHLAHVGAAVGIVGEGDGVGDEWFGGDELHLEAIENVEGLCSVLRLHGRGGGELEGQGGPRETQKERHETEAHDGG